jgi:hypothetical protein
VIGWAPLQPEIQAQQGAALSRPPFSQQVPAMPAMPAMPPPRTIQPRRSRQPRPLVHHPLPAYRESPVTAPPSEPVLLPPVLPDPAPQPESARPGAPQHTSDAESEAAALTVLDLPILLDDDPDTRESYERPPRLTSLHLLGAILLHVAGLLADGDPEVYVEAAIAQYTSVALMIWCLVLIFRRTRA